MQEQFFALADAVTARLKGEEGFLLRFSGETSQFVRFTRAAVRQPGTVDQRYVALELFRGKRHAETTLALTEARNEDLTRVGAALAELREVLADTPEDPHFLINTMPQSTSRIAP